MEVRSPPGFEFRGKKKTSGRRTEGRRDGGTDEQTDGGTDGGTDGLTESRVHILFFISTPFFGLSLGVLKKSLNQG